MGKFFKIAVYGAVAKGVGKGLRYVARKGAGMVPKTVGGKITGAVKALDEIASPGKHIAKAVGVKTSPNLLDETLFLGVPLTAAMKGGGAHNYRKVNKSNPYENWGSIYKKSSVQFKTNRLLENAVTSRVALEGTQDKKTMDNLKYYNKIKNSSLTPTYLLNKAEDKIIEKNKKKHGRFIYDTFGNIPDKKYKQLVMTSINKMNKGYDKMKQTHTADSLALVGSGQKYPKAVDNYFAELKRKKAAKMQKISAMNLEGLPSQPYDGASNVPTYQDPFSGKGGILPKVNRPYNPKIQPLPTFNKAPNIRPIPPSEKDLITTRSNSILNNNKPIPGVKK